jgi:hypothetical protein
MRTQESDLVYSNEVLTDPAALRSRAQSDGYLYLKNILPAENVRDARRLVFSEIYRAGLLEGRDSAKVNKGAWDSIPRNELVGGLPKSLYSNILKIEALHQLTHHKGLLHVWELLFEEEPLVHPNNMPRIVIPGRAINPTPPHQDYPFVQGTTSTWTCWVALGDVPRSLGGLAILKGSHRLGMLPMIEIPESSFGIGVDVSELSGPWLCADYEIGDALFFQSLTVHRALPNRGDIIRISMDCRAQPWSHPIQTDSLRPYAHRELSLTWEQLYENWSDDSLKYYWRKRNLKLSSYDGDMFPASAFRNRSKEEAVEAKNNLSDVL